MELSMLLNQTTAVITGAASGIGQKTAMTYADHGANVVVADIDEAAGRDTVETIVSDDGEATFVKTDVSSATDVKETIETALEEYSGLDVLFNNAGILGPLSEFHKYDEAALDQIINVNLKGVFYGIKYGIKAMKADGGGSIISTSSIASETGLLGRSGYTATKAGINGMSRSAAMEYAQDGIRVNTILPGIIETSMHHESADQKPPERFDRFDISEPMPGKGQPEDIANAALFLGSDLSARITGVQLPIDGGFLIQP